MREEVLCARSARERFVSESQDYKVELIDDLPPRRRPISRCIPSRCTPTGRSQTCAAGPHAPTTKTVGRLQAAVGRRRLLARGSTRTMLTRIYGTAFSHQYSTERVPGAPGAGSAARPSQARTRARVVSLLRRVARRRVLVAGRHEHVQRARLALARDGLGAWRQRGQDAADLRRRAVEDLRALGQVQGEHVHRRQVEEREMGVKPMNCPAHCPPVSTAARHSYRDLPVRYFGAGTASPQRGLTGVAARSCCASGTSHQDERSHLLQRGSDPRGGERAAWSSTFATYSLFDFDVRLELFHPTRAARRRRRAVGPRRGSLCERARCAGPRVRAESRRRSVLRAEDRLRRHRLVGRSWQLGTVQLDYNAPERSGSPTRAPTTPSTSP